MNYNKHKAGVAQEGYVQVRGARENNLKDVSLSIPRDALVVFTGVSGSGKSSLAFSTLYAEAQRRYLESVSPYARRLFHQMAVPEVDEISGLPPAVALQQKKGNPTTRSTVGSVSTISNLLRMLYSRAGDYPRGQELLYAESFSPNTAQGACPQCQGLGRVYEVTEQSMVPDDSLSIREKAIAAWPSAWHGQNLREILITLGYDIDKPWRQLPKKDRDWILFSDEQPVVPVYSGWERDEVKEALKRKLAPSYMGTFTGVKKYVMQTFATTTSALMKKRVSQFMVGTDCPLCQGKKLNRQALSVSFCGMDIAAISALPFSKLYHLLQPFLQKDSPPGENNEKQMVISRIGQDIHSRLQVLLNLGLGYLSASRSTPTLSPGEHQRLRLATQVHSNLFGVVYMLDEPSAGLHPADTEALLKTLQQLKAAGNSLFVVEHEPDIIRQADWVVDVGPGAGEQGGQIIYSGPTAGLEHISTGATAHYLFNKAIFKTPGDRQSTVMLSLKNVSRNNVYGLDISFPLGMLTSVTGVSGSGKSSVVSQVLVELVSKALGHHHHSDADAGELLQEEGPVTRSGYITEGIEQLKRLVVVDQKPIGRTPRSNLATYTGLFDGVRKLFAATKQAKAKKYDAGRFSFNVNKGRCAHCQGEGFVMVELLFLPSVYTPCPQCKGTRYNAKTLVVKYKDHNIADVLQMTVDQAYVFFDKETTVRHALETLRQVGLGYLRLGQPATELSG
ncbi:MAG: excinuclease ABC subunit UvrA, partial [Sphingobacteriales bacterium]